MPRPTEKTLTPSRRMATYRQRMRAAGLRPVQIWVPDTRAPGFAEACRAQVAALAAADPAGAEALRFIEAALEWPEP